MNGYLLDTCICVFLFRNKFDIEKKLNQIGFSDCYVSRSYFGGTSLWGIPVRENTFGTPTD